MNKKKIIEAFGGNEQNTGSTAVQVALLTQRILSLNGHLTENKKDHSAHRGLMILVGRRRRLLNYLERTNRSEYLEVLQKLELRK